MPLKPSPCTYMIEYNCSYVDVQEEFLDSSFLEVVSYCKNPEATVSGFLYLPSVTNHGRCHQL